MTVLSARTLVFRSDFATRFPELCRPVPPTEVSDPQLVVASAEAASALGLEHAALSDPALISILAGSTVIDGEIPVAQAYSGHQFGGLSPVLGDGRARLLGEVVGSDGTLCDLHLKGSGRTVFSRGGDGNAGLGPMLREYVISEAMAALGIPTTRSLAVLSTGNDIFRDGAVPGAILVRTAASHLRVGTFQFAALYGGPDVLSRLVGYAIERHFPNLAGAENPALGVLDRVAAAQASLVAQWMAVGFIHGVMNTDNTTISGETIDYGPCAFMDEFDPATVFSSIDRDGRYAYQNQPRIMEWNLSRFAETLLPLIDDDKDRAVEKATEVVSRFGLAYSDAWLSLMRIKLGLPSLDTTASAADRTARDRDDADLITRLFDLMQASRVDYTGCLRDASRAVRGDLDPMAARFADDSGFREWAADWLVRVRTQNLPLDVVTGRMDAHNPIYIPRNHLVEAALAAAQDEGDLAPLNELVSVVTQPFALRNGAERFAEPNPNGSGGYRTFCGT